MIEHEDLLRMPVHKFDRGRKLPLEDEDVIHEPEVLQHGDASIEIRAEDEPVIRFVLHDVSHCTQLRIRGKFCDHFAHARIRQRQPADDALDEIILIREREQPLRLADSLPRLHGNDAIDPDRRNLRLQMRRQKIAAQRSHRIADPRIFLRAIFPKVVMRIDLHAWHMTTQGRIRFKWRSDELRTALSALRHARMPFTILPCTSVSR